MGYGNWTVTECPGEAESMRYCEVSPVIASSPEAARADGAAWPSWDSGAGGVDGRNATGQRRTGAGR